MDLLNILENNAKGGIIWPKIRESRNRQAFKEKQYRTWKGKIVSPSKMSLNECPFELYYTINDPNAPPKYKNVDPESLIYKGFSGKYKHLEFQEDLKNLDVPDLRLFQAPTKEELDNNILEQLKKYNREYTGSVEFPLFIPDYEIIAYIDAIVERKVKNEWDGKPIPLDFKFKHNEKKVFKQLVKEGTILGDDSFTQIAVYGWHLRNSQVLGPILPEFGLLNYYNVCQVGEIDAEQEYRVLYKDDLMEIIKYYLDTHKEAVVAYKSGQEHDPANCKYEYCTNKLDVTRWVK